MNLYDYVILRYVPKVEREEFFNIGVMMMCKRRRWLRLAYAIDENKFSCFNHVHTREELLEILQGYVDVADGNGEGYLHGLPAEERFRWLSAVRSTCLQCSRPHPGLTDDLDATFQRLFREYVI